MNYFEFYPGDYSRDTSDLTLAEHGAYLLLLAAYYGQEKPLPAPAEALYRVARAMITAEQKAVRAVADRFFPVAEDGLRHNARADAEIEKAQGRIAAAKENGRRGGRPKKNPMGSENKTQKKPTGFPLGSENKTQPITQTITQTKAHQTPHEKLESPDGDLSPAAPEDQLPKARKPCPQSSIVELYHEVLPELRQVREWNETRQRLLAKRWAESRERQSLDWWRDFFGYVRKSRFLMGQTVGREGRPFDCDLEWLIRPTNFAKVIEGKYEDGDA